jgi:Insertion element 4 transposase N-terminal/Transposase DDE domain
MDFKLRQIRPNQVLNDEMTMDGLNRIVPTHMIESVLVAEGRLERRVRKLSSLLTVWIVIGMGLYADQAIQAVLKTMAHGLRLIWPDWTVRTANASAISQRRAQLGSRVMMRLFQAVCQPLATPSTRGACLFGLRLMAIDGTLDDVPDTPANALVFGRYHGAKGDSAFPKVRSLLLVECGTHAVVDAGFWPCHIHERVGARRLLRSITPDMLVLLDRGLYGFDLFQAIVRRGSHVLVRVPAHVVFEVQADQRSQRLPDGSLLTCIRPTDYKRRKQGVTIPVRVIEYTFCDPNRPGFDQTHRVLTTLLDPVTCPALDLVCAFHERWEAELTIDELQTHQRLNPKPLRSLTPRGVIQELYGLLIAHYIIRAFMHEAAVRANLDPDQLSFVGAFRLVQHAVPEFQLAHPSIHPHLLDRLLRDIAHERLPPRRNRVNPRVVKRHVLRYILKRPEHAHWPQPSCEFRCAVRLI